MQQRTRKSRGPGAVSRWMEHTANARAKRKIRRGHGKFMGMDVLILHTVGRRSGRPRETPLMHLPDGEHAVLVVASGGGDRNPDWHANLVAHPDQASIELPGREPVPVTPHELEGAERERAWQRVAAAQPRIAKYQSKAGRRYPLIRLTHR
ncbi:nitroreductase family deazaflavin-dependent oxidoreductase [Rhodococcus chondri]|uniref:Nitroreductase family deazaflavin-dependent oxidoreductase n=1 Tax=Rhodococcus chondri TaxID=3065941 RepID=A0ABU7JRC9_9NOCA|nr:nitroreductase family deazaflavin-dependent oxidoreductase [Rhodococcus sp. CC-R104]MEE2032596.1 nitroreductase family deazaflavin-dependent oxidoreductase [Rhodococcus sp. CC-R104]